MKVSVKPEGSGFVVVVENENQGYKQSFKFFEPRRGEFGVTTDAVNEAYQKAVVDAEDWVAKYQAAGIKAELV
jgi:hypothetical protein